MFVFLTTSSWFILENTPLRLRLEVAAVVEIVHSPPPLKEIPVLLTVRLSIETII